MVKDKKILVSVVIPTYNRYKYLKGCISAFDMIGSDEIEFVIQDNTCDNSEILEYLEEIHDKRIKYYHKAAHVSVVENSNLAIEHSSGEYVIFIGDDDTVCASIVDAAKFCKENNIDTCLFELPGFNWPDMEFHGKESQANLFLVKPVTGEVRRINLAKQLDWALDFADGIPEYMPRVYHGMTSRLCLNKIKEKTGSYFPGPSPDMASSLAITLVAENAVYISDYLMVSGYGYKSARGEGNRNQHYGKINEKPWLPEDTEILWDSEIPKIFSGETIIAESLSRCLRAMGREDLLKRYSYGILYAVFFMRHPEARRYMAFFLLKKSPRIFKFAFGIIKRRRYISNYRKTHDRTNYRDFNGVESLVDAVNIVNKYREDVSKYYFEGSI